MSLLFDEHRELDASIEVDPDVMRGRWRWPVGPALTASGLFLAVDFAFFAANLFKIREGGWIPLTFGTLVFIVMVSWHFGFEAMRDRHSMLAERPDEFFRRLRESRVPCPAQPFF